jgi:hypothetical protein
MRVKLMLRLAVVMLTCLLLWAALLWLRPASPLARADPGSLFVVATGTGAACSQAQPCGLQTALAQAVNGDTVYLGAGTYTGGGDAVITIATSLTLYGGWNGAPGGPVVRDPHVYTSTVDGESQRRVVHVDSGTSVTLEGFTVARGMVIGDGGGLYASGLALTLRAMTFMSNVITSTEYCWGAGAFVEGGTLLVEASTFRRNWGFGTSSSYGGGIAISHTLTTTVAGCQFEDNDTWFGCGVDVVGAGRSQTRFTLTGSTFVNNGRGYSGNPCSGGYAVAIEVSNAHARIEGNTIRGSYGSNDYGAVAVFASDLTLTGNLIIDNNSGRTAALYLHSVNPFAVTNNVIAANRMSSAGSPAVRVIGGSGQFVHNTIACNEGGPGLLIDSGATVWLTDTIIVSHTLGISVSAGSTVTMEGTLWGSGPWANGTDQAGGGAITTGAVNVRGDPAFVDPAGRDYHIGSFSAAIDAGVNAGVSVDMDGDPRPCGSGYDIGADEYCGPVVRRFVYLPLVLRAAGR